MAGARPRSPADAVLAAVLVLECVGALGIALRQGSGVEVLATTVALAASLVVALLRERRAAYVVAGWFLWEAAFETAFGTGPLSSLELVCHAARYGVAIAVAQPRMAQPVLRLAASLTFIGHGIEAIALKPIFLAYIQHTAGLVGVSLAPETVAGLLRAIGSIDLVLGGAMLWGGRSRFVAGYMGSWGIVTALARVVYAGPAGIVDALVRAANGGGPLALLLSWRDDAPRRPSNEP